MLGGGYTVYHYQSINVNLNSFKINLVGTSIRYQNWYSVYTKTGDFEYLQILYLHNYYIKNFISGSVGTMWNSTLV